MDNPIVTVIALPTFARNIRALIKKYRSILEDIQPIIVQLENGETPGDQVAGIGYPVFKLRIKNSDNQKGKSGGYRLIYYLNTNDKILLLTLYSKSEQDDVVAGDLRDIIEEYNNSNPETPSQQ
jgi:mRNA-degrading endonuclease RelE of RelBE toxin-antitoxin system